MNRWSRIVFAIACVGAVAWMGAGWAGREVASDPDRMPIHTLLGFGATLTLLFADCWIVTFLVACERAARQLGPAGTAAADRGTGARRRAVLLGGLAAATSVGHFALSGLLFPQRLEPRIHLALAGVAFGLQVVFMVVARRDLTAQNRQFTHAAGPAAG